MSRWSTARTVSQVERVVESLGYDRFENLRVSGYTSRGSSSYIEFVPLQLTIRVSDHPQPFNGQWGGYNEQTQTRHVAADLSISPTEHTIDELKWWLLQQINLDNLPYLRNESESMEFGRS